MSFLRGYIILKKKFNFFIILNNEGYNDRKRLCIKSPANSTVGGSLNLTFLKKIDKINFF